MHDSASAIGAFVFAFSTQPAWYEQNGSAQSTTIVQVGTSVNIQA